MEDAENFGGLAFGFSVCHKYLNLGLQVVISIVTLFIREFPKLGTLIWYPK